MLCVAAQCRMSCRYVEAELRVSPLLDMLLAGPWLAFCPAEKICSILVGLQLVLLVVSVESILEPNSKQICLCLLVRVPAGVCLWTLLL